jgi:hypothetical protein
VSGSVVVVFQSGGSISGQIAWGTGLSGQTCVQTVNGSYVSVSGIVGQTISSAFYQISSVSQTTIALSGAVTVPTYLSYALLHLNSNMNVSSEFAVYYKGSIGTGAYSSKIYSMNMSGHADVLFTPDPRFTLQSGDAISMFFTNSGSLTVAMQMAYSVSP